MVAQYINRCIKFLMCWRRNCIYRKSDYGRNYGWYVEYEGKVIGELIDPRFTDMFWFSYVLQSLDETHKEILYNQEYWMQSKFDFRNKRHPIYVHAFAGGDFLNAEGRVNMRGLYLDSCRPLPK